MILAVTNTKYNRKKLRKMFPQTGGGTDMMTHRSGH